MDQKIIKESKGEQFVKFHMVGLILFSLLSFDVGQAATSEPEISEAEIATAKAAQAKHQASIMKQSGVNGIGVGLMEDGKRVGIHIFVTKGKRPQLPSQLDNVPVRIIEAGPFKAHDGPCTSGAPCHVQAVALPVQMGNSTGNVNGIFSGTMGFRAIRKGDPSKVGYITNNHVGAAGGANLCPAQLNPANLTAFGTTQCQPGLLDAAGNVCIAPSIGELIQVVPLIMGDEYVNTVDAAFVESNRGCVSKRIRDIGSPTGTTGFPVLGSVVLLSGRTSGFLRNRVVAINTSLNVDYDASCGSALFMGQAVTQPITGASASLPGDSGSPVVNTSRKPVGLNFAGDGVFGIITPMPYVLNSLGLVIDTAPDAPASATCP